MIRSKIVGHVDKQLLLSSWNNCTAIKAIHGTREVIKKTARSRQGCRICYFSNTVIIANIVISHLNAKSRGLSIQNWRSLSNGYVEEAYVVGITAVTISKIFFCLIETKKKRKVISHMSSFLSTTFFWIGKSKNNTSPTNGVLTCDRRCSKFDENSTIHIETNTNKILTTAYLRRWGEKHCKS